MDTHTTQSLCIACGSTNSRLEFRFKLYNFLRCANCGLVYVHPTPTQEDIEEIYGDGKFYSVGMERRIGKENYRRFKVIKHISKRGRILDIGCAAGFFLSLARENGWDTFGVELSKPLSDYANKKLKVSVINKPLESIDLPDNSFDVVTFWGVIEHVFDPNKFMKHAARLVKENGLLCFATNNIDGWMGRLMKDKFSFISYPEHLWLFNIRTVKKIVENAGLKIERIETFDTITADKAIRGIDKVFSSNLEDNNSKIFKICMETFTKAAQPLLWLTGKMMLGSEIEVYARKVKS